MGTVHIFRVVRNSPRTATAVFCYRGLGSLVIPSVNRCSLFSSLSLSLLPLRSIMLLPNFALNYIKFSHVVLLPLPGQSTCLHLMPNADTGLQGWLNRNYTHLAPGHGSTRTTHKVATVHLAHPPLQLSGSIASVLEIYPKI